MSIKRQYASDNREFDYASEVLDKQHENTEDELEFRTFETGDGYEIELSMLRPGMCRLTVTAFVDDVRDEEVIVDATFETERAEEIVRTARAVRHFHATVFHVEGVCSPRGPGVETD